MVLRLYNVDIYCFCIHSSDDSALSLRVAAYRQLMDSEYSSGDHSDLEMILRKGLQESTPALKAIAILFCAKIWTEEADMCKTLTPFIRRAVESATDKQVLEAGLALTQRHRNANVLNDVELMQIFMQLGELTIEGKLTILQLMEPSIPLFAKSNLPAVLNVLDVALRSLNPALFCAASSFTLAILSSVEDTHMMNAFCRRLQTIVLTAVNSAPPEEAHLVLEHLRTHLLSNTAIRNALSNFGLQFSSRFNDPHYLKDAVLKVNNMLRK